MHDSQTGLTAELNSDRGDVLIRGFWSRDADCIVDVRICDVNQPSYVSRNPESIIKSAENEKKNKCLALFRAKTPLYPVHCIMRIMMGKEANTFIRRLAQCLSKKWHRPYSRNVGFIRSRFAISLVRAKNRCLRGSRVMSNSISRRIDWDDGADLGLHSTLE